MIIVADYRQRIRDIREDKDLTQTELGKLLDKSQQGYNHIEAGRAELKIDDLVKLCKFYNLSADYIIGLTDKKRSTNRPHFHFYESAVFKQGELYYQVQHL